MCEDKKPIQKPQESPQQPIEKSEKGSLSEGLKNYEQAKPAPRDEAPKPPPDKGKKK